MKKLFLLSCLACGFAPSLHAQGNDQTAYEASSPEIKRLRFGFYVAPTLSWMRPTTQKEGPQKQTNDGSKIGFSYGILADYNFASNYTLATGLQINATGGKIATDNPSAANGEVLSSKYDYSLQYIEIPIALKLRSNEKNNITFFGQAGVTIGANISKKATYTVIEKGDPDNTTFESDSKEKIRGSFGAIAPVMFQMNIGGGIHYAIDDKLALYAGLFFNNGFAPDATQPDKYNNVPKFSDGTTRLNNVALRFGFYF
jgi:hypothetical protein